MERDAAVRTHSCVVRLSGSGSTAAGAGPHQARVLCSLNCASLSEGSNRDRFISRAAAQLCGRYVTGPYRFTELDGASHWLPEQAADQVAALLAEHFATTP
jgi:pimeloyl-ACP methyl ester carboxylesterase